MIPKGLLVTPTPCREDLRHNPREEAGGSNENTGQAAGPRTVDPTLWQSRGLQGESHEGPHRRQASIWKHLSAGWTTPCEMGAASFLLHHGTLSAAGGQASSERPGFELSPGDPGKLTEPL